MVELVIRLGFSLAVVVGLLLLCARVAQKRTGGRRGDVVRVVQRQALTRGSAVTVVTVGSRILVLGTTEQQVSVLTELDPDDVLGLDLDDVVAPPAPHEPSVLTGSTSHLRLLDDADPEPVAPSVGRHAARSDTTPPRTTSPSSASPSTASRAGTRAGTRAAPRSGTRAAPRSGSRAATRQPGRRRATAPVVPAAPGGMHGSVLSPATWRQARAALGRRAS